MRLRPAACFAALFVALTAGPGSAAPLRFPDPVGDATGKQSSLDIVYVEFSTIGTGKGARYVPWDVVVTMRLNNRPAGTPGVRYVVTAEVEGCDYFQFAWAPPEAGLQTSSFQASCSNENADMFRGSFATEGASLKWRIPISALPKGMRVGSKFTNIVAYVDAGDPLVLPGTGTLADAGVDVFDVARTSATWVLR